MRKVTRKVCKLELFSQLDAPIKALCNVTERQIRIFVSFVLFLIPRTAALFALVACSAKLSGASAPSFNSGDWSTAAGLHAAAREWGEFLVKGLALDLLARHFEGFESALACM